MKRRKRIAYGCLLLAAFLSVGARQFPEQAGKLADIFQKNDPLSSRAVTLVPDSITSIQAFQVTDGAQDIDLMLCGIKSLDADTTSGDAPREHLKELLEKSDGNLSMLTVRSRRNAPNLAEIFVSLPNTDEEIHLNTQLILDGVAQLDLNTVDSCPNAEALYRVA